VRISCTRGDAIIAVRIAIGSRIFKKEFAMRKFLVGFGVLAMVGVSQAGVVWTPISAPTMGEFALAALAITVGIAAARFIKKK
jgi:hypothetical protein